jgi:hypothetical protein
LVKGRVPKPGRAIGNKSEVGQNPAIGQFVVNHDRIAERIGVAERSGRPPGKERVLGKSCQERAGVFVVDGVSVIDRLDVMIRPDVAIRIGRKPGSRDAAGDAIESRQAEEISERRGHRSLNNGNRWRLGCLLFRNSDRRLGVIQLLFEIDRALRQINRHGRQVANIAIERLRLHFRQTHCLGFAGDRVVILAGRAGLGCDTSEEEKRRDQNESER